ncbi:MAG: T9SS type A sorting domain-containing protein [Flavobacteriales bacterium]|jgi:hypothetical protein
MNLWKTLGCWLLLLGVCLGARGQSLLLLSPNGGEQWLGASQQVISWTYTNVDNIDIQYSGDNGLTWTNIVEDYPSSALQYTWTVPSNGNNQSLIRIISALSFTEDQSDGVFTIPEPTIELLYPSAETYQTGTIQYVEWVTSGIAQVVLQYSTNNGQTWTNVNTSPAAHNYANWNTPSTPGNVLVRIHNIEDITKQDVSNTITITQANPDNPTKYAGSPYDGYDMSTSLPSSVTVVAPNGGETLEPYTTYTIEWSYVDVTWVDIAYSIDNGSTWTTIASQLPADALEYAWEVPNTPSTQCLMRVTASPESVQDISNSTFVIDPAGLVLTYPNDGESFDAGTIQYIEWEYNGVASVLAQYSTNNGQSWTTIGTSPAEHRYINWTVPSAAGGNILLRLSDVDVPTTTDQCDLPLPIEQPSPDNPTKYLGSPWDGYSMNDSRPDTLEITSPNGDEMWMSSTVQEITWTYNNVDQVKLEYTIDDGNSWTVINNNLPASQLSYDWTVPTTPSNLCRVRITENTRPNITDLSDNPFIIPTGYVQITYPNGGESFGTGTIQYIEWEHGGLATVKLEYSTDNGASWIVIGTSPANDRYMNWYTPSTPSANCRIRVSDLANGNVYYDLSNVAFAVTAAAPDNPTKYAGSPYDGYSMYAYVDEYVKVIKPNGGEFWGNGTTQQIKWLTLNNDENLTIEYTTDGESNWTTLLNNIPNTPNTYNWAINATPSTICKVRATTITGSETDKSDYFFTIANPAGIVTSGITGSSFCPGNTVVVNYTASSSFNADNQFIVQLSDSVGQFSGPVENIGSVSAASPVPITATIPVRYYTSNLYRLRVIATSPPTLGPDNGVNFTINPLPAVELGEDVLLCTGDAQTFDATNENATYAWSTGATSPTITVNTGGTYSVTVTNACGTTSDTVAVEMITAPIVDLGDDVQICQNDVVILDADSNAVTYQWSTGAITPSIIVSLPGNYSVAATNECGTTTDQVNVSVIAAPTVELGNNFGICPGETVALTAATPNASYEWSTGATTESIVVDAPGIYWVNVTTSCGVLSDQVFAYDGAINLDAGEDVQLCAGETATLMATGANEYEWSNGLTESIIEVSPAQTTTYSVTAINVYGCSATDEVVVNVNASPAVPVISIAGTATFCSNEPSTLSIEPISGAQYQWLRNMITLEGATEAIYIPQQSGTYTVEIINADGCAATAEPVTITVLPAFEETIILQAENGTANYNGDVLVPGVYEYLFGTVDGCDSLFIVQVVDSAIVGCVIETACNYNPLAGVADNAQCVFPDCDDETACNFNPNAACSDSLLCVFADIYLDCEGGCLNDSDQDAVCDELEVLGCIDPLACNYDSLATESNGFCVYALLVVDCEGNCLNDLDGDSVCDEFEITGCADSLACNYDATVTESDSSCVFAELYYDCTGSCLNDADNDGVCDELDSDGCSDSLACNYSPLSNNPDSSLCLYPIPFSDCSGSCLNDIDNDGVCDELEVVGCADSLACNYDALATDSDSSCVYAEQYFDCLGGCLNDTDDDGVCDELEVIGCLDSLACNYDATVTESDSSCVFAELYYDCTGLCLNDTDNDGVCDELESEGCTDSLACNYNATVLTDDGTCVYPGCTDSLACNYNVLAGCDDGSCVQPDACGSCEGISGCTDVLACNYDSLATCDDSTCFWIETFAIVGLDSVLMDSLAVYSYFEQPGSTYQWTVSGGTIIGQADSSLVLVTWGPAGIGEVCVTESQDSCVGQPVCMQVVISDPSSIAEWNEGNWLIYPNPSTGLFRLVTRDASLRSFEVLDALGQRVHSGSLHGLSTEIDVSTLAAGHYLIRCGSAYKRLVIVR